MSRFIRTVLISAYSALFFQFIKSLLVNRNIEIIELEYILDRKPAWSVPNKTQLRVVSFAQFKLKQVERLPTDFKYILKWTPVFSHFNAPAFVYGQHSFLDHNCSINNCFMTNEKTMLNDVRHFDAILFDVENNWDIHPPVRSPHQRYVFLAAESAANYPVCTDDTEDYYNLTWTYRLDSDIRWSYVTVLDLNGTFVGPKIDMHWVQPMLPTPDNVRRIIQGKNKTAAWFVSRCNSRSNRTRVADKIKDALKNYGLEIDVYGWCGTLRCPRDRLEDCLELMEREYYFYLAFENSICEDYVTEKLMYPLLHHTVPIVFGGANYSRFLPPGSYIDAGALEAQTVALKIFQAVKNPEIYADYFRWHNHYKYKQTPEATDVCQLCKILNGPLTYSAKKDLKVWWNKNYKIDCKG